MTACFTDPDYFMVALGAATGLGGLVVITLALRARERALRAMMRGEFLSSRDTWGAQ